MVPEPPPPPPLAPPLPVPPLLVPPLVPVAFPPAPVSVTRLFPLADRIRAVPLRKLWDPGMLG